MSELAQELDELGGDVTTALEEILVPSALVDRRGLIRWQNRASRAQDGDRSDESFLSLLPPDLAAEAESLLSKILSSGRAAELPLRVRLPDGRVELREISAAPVHDGGNIVGVFGLSTRAPTGSPPVEATAGSDLTRRQREVLALLAKGMSTDEIAAELGIGTTTVRNHVANLIAALGVHTRLQAVIAASRAGLI
jgi:DNA-binding CsgD family transcriptional regulator